MVRRRYLYALIPLGLFAFATYASAASSFSYGDSGQGVVALQDQLIKAGYLPVGKNTGYFGSQTRDAIEKFQCTEGIICSGASVSGYGIAGPRTQAALETAVGAPVIHAQTVPQRALSMGDEGSDVTALQNALITQHYLAADKNTGYFGSLTRTAVREFQCAEHIACSTSVGGYGVYGPQTRAALSAAFAVPAQPSTILGAPLTGPATGPFEISGWIPDWRAASGTQDVLPHLSLMTSVMPFGYTVSNSGNVTDNMHLDQGSWPAFITSAKQAGVRIVPTIEWGNGASEQEVLSNTSKRIALEDQIANLVKQNGFDGIDIDFEAKEAATINYFSTFLQGLYDRMDNKWVYCTIEARMPLDDRYTSSTSIPQDATVYANNYSAMNKYCDRVEIMAYDQGTIDLPLDAERPAPYAPVADPAWVEDLVNLAAQSISRNKLIIGIPDYGYEYEVTPLSGSGYKYDVLWAFNPPYATQIAAQLHIAPVRTSAGELGFVYSPQSLTSTAPTDGDSTKTQQSVSTTSVVQNENGNTVVNIMTQPFNYVTWSDAQAVADKVALAKKLGVRGVAIFSLGGAEDQNMWSVLK